MRGLSFLSPFGPLRYYYPHESALRSLLRWQYTLTRLSSEHMEGERGSRSELLATGSCKPKARANSPSLELLSAPHFISSPFQLSKASVLKTCLQAMAQIELRSSVFAMKEFWLYLISALVERLSALPFREDFKHPALEDMGSDTLQVMGLMDYGFVHLPAGWVYVTGVGVFRAFMKRCGWS